MMASPPPARLAVLIARTEARLNASYELAQMSADTLRQAREAAWRSRQLLAQRVEDEPSKVKRHEGRNTGDVSEA
jgi:ribosome-binding protein aMBF1 (putative translation factor)